MKAHEAAQLLARLRSLPPKKRLFLEQRLLEKGIEVERLGILPRLGPRDTFPMSHTQERVFFLHRLDPGDVAYNIWSYHYFSGPLDEKALEVALFALVKRHEILRTTFSGAGGELVQRVRSPKPLELPCLDLSHLPAAARAAAVRRTRHVERRRAFDLEEGPLLRWVLVRLQPTEHVLVFTMHHILSDAWSLAVFQRELQELYAGRSLPPLSIQFGDFAHWQRGWQQRVEEPAQLDYWKERLTGAPEELDLPLDRPRPAVQSTSGGNVLLRLPAPVAERLKAFCRTEGATLAMGLLTLYKALLLRLSGQRDLCIGMAVAGRNREELESLIGFFANTLVLRTDLARLGLRGALRKVRKGLIEAQDHQDLSFARLVEVLKPRRSLAVTPLFQANFAMVSTPFYSGSGTLSPFDTPRDSALFDLDLELLERSSGEVTGWLYYATALFDSSTILRLRQLWLRLLRTGLEQPERPLEELAVLGASERHQLLVEWNPEPLSVPAGTLVDRFTAVAARTPHRPAVVLGERWLSYGELAARSALLAHHLRDAGVGPEAVVGLCLERSEELLIALLGILRAGAAYLPLDPGYPPEHLAFLARDAGVVGIVTRLSLAASLAQVEAPRMLLEEVPWALRLGSTAGPEVKLDPHQAAYIIFTSGSTGRPKGVVVSHHNALRLFDVTTYPFALGPEDAWTLFHSHAFDFSVWEIFGALLFGARLEVVPRLLARSPEEFARLLHNRRITVLNQTPSAFRVLRRALDGLGRGALRLLIFGGEALDPAALGPWLAGPAPRPVNMYGITETTVHVTLRPLGPRDAGTRSPIGRPLADLGALVADRRGQPVPLGVAGELLVAGAGLARGYQGRPGLTAERFVPHASARTPGERLYRSGDRARFLGNGDLEYLGRIDQQLKVRGFRIEPGEIETVVASLAGVREVAVVAHGEAPPRLVAWVVVGEEACSPEALRSQVADRLPGHMVPAIFALVEALPLSRTGKVDRRALASKEPPKKTGEATGDPPRTPAEELLATLWSRVLKVESIGRGDNFFELGGDSILCIQIVAQAEVLGLRLTPRQFFQHQTLAELAAAAGEAEQVRAEQGEVVGAAVLTPVQHWFFEQSLEHRHHFNQAVLLVRRRPVRGLGAAVEALVAHHDALRLRFEREGDGWRQHGIPSSRAQAGLGCRIDLGALPQANRLAALEGATAQLQGSLHLGQGPVFRIVDFHFGGEEGRLFALAHHLVIDAVSWRILLNDLEGLLLSAERGEKARLPAKTTSYRHWGEGLARLALSDQLDSERDFWTDPRRRKVPPLPLDDPTAPNTPNGARTVRVHLEAEETEALLRQVPKAYRTRIDEVLLAALLRAFHHFTGEPRLLLELEGHGRGEEALGTVDLSRTVGWFTTLFPLLLELPEAETTESDLLCHVKETLRAVPGRGLGFGVLRYLGDENTRKALAELPEPEVSFNYLGQLDQALPEGELFALAGENPGPMTRGRHKRRYQLEINGGVQGERLTVGFTHGPTLRPATVEALARGFLDTLRRLMAHCTAPGVGGYTPSDFPLTTLDATTLEKALGGARHGIADLYPLSPTQQGMLFFHLYDPDSRAYRVQNAHQLDGPLDTQALRRAFEQLFEQHGVLRTGFVWEGLEEPLQVVYERVEPLWTELDLRHLEEAEQRDRLEQHLAAERERGFDLRRPPLLWLTLARLGEESHLLNWTQHHILFDGWSGPLLFAELAVRYGALVTGRPPRLPRMRPYREYIAWLEEQDLSRAEAFWRRQLAGYRQPLALGFEAATTGVPKAAERHGQTAQLLPAEKANHLRRLMAEERLTLNTLVQGLWALLLSRASGQTDVVFGATVSGRSAPVPGLDTMVGLFINSLPVRVEIDLDAPFAQWGKALQEHQAEAREYEHTPLWRIQKWSEVPTEHPLFETLLVFENYPTEVDFSAASRDAPDEAPAQATNSEAPVEGQAPRRGLVASPAHAFERTNYPFTLIVLPSESDWHFLAAWDLRLYEPELGHRLVTTLLTLLEGVAQGPHARLRDLPLLREAECEQILGTFASSEGATEVEETVVHTIARQASAAPEAIALVAGVESLSYGELWRRALELAGRLTALGVGPEEPVALFLERSPHLMVGLLGTLAAGGAYLPLDPRTPARRLAFCLEDAGARWVLTERSLLSSVPESTAQILLLDDPSTWPESTEAHPKLPAPGHLAYLLYTSGSTGQPKAVAVEHRSLEDYCRTAAAGASLGPGERVLQFASLAFDTSAEEIYPCWMSGATLVLRDEAMLDFPHLLAACNRHRLTVLDLPTAYWHEWVHHLERDPSPPNALRLVILGGEAARAEAVAAWHRVVGPEVLLVNTYGPTEATVVVTQWPLTEPPAPREAASGPSWPPIPIGRPRPGIRTYVLDSDLHPVPPSLPGMLYLAGSGLARGYLGRPALTAQAFVPDPFGPAGERLYRSGDRARFQESGLLEFLGRGDHQVKLRGFRVELGEVEAALRHHPTIDQAVAFVQPGAEGRRLVACYTATTEVEVEALRTHLRAALPDYMVPAALVHLEELPQTTSGKIDRRALTDQVFEGKTEERPVTPPRDALEESLLNLWRRLFDGPLGVEDDFFELGGDSILALRFTTLMRDELHRTVPLAVLFERRTLAGLADFLRSETELQEAERQGPLVMIRAAGTRPPLTFVHPAGGNVLCYDPLARALGPEQPFLGLQAPELVGQSGGGTVEERATLYVEALREVQPTGPYALGGWSVGGVIALEMARQLEAEGAKVPLLALLDTLTPHTLPTWPGAELVVTFAQDLGLRGVATATLSLEAFRTLPLEAQLDHLLTRTQAEGLLPQSAGRTEILTLWQTFESIVRSIQKHHLEAYPGPVLLLRAAQAPPSPHGEDLGWSHLLPNLQVTKSPGLHQNMVYEPHVGTLAHHLRRQLTRLPKS